jgi:hypothetical protein
MKHAVARMLVNQYRAALDTLAYVIEECPDKEWNERHGDYPFSQVVFHALFYTDFYLGSSEREFKEQEYHRKHTDLFSDYEELEDRLPVHLYERHEIWDYLGFCVTKADQVTSTETLESLEAQSGFPRRLFSRGELHMMNIRHIQHHAAQLGLRLQFLTGKEMPWFSTGKV